ncbi:MAG: Tm-1-like ATP-binding domain-containing protein [Marinagarivorans sp.]|nr:Tm-1-like ATP-binding domain-containing protein [Marinagarivorans sp.]
MEPTIYVVGTFDTKSAELFYLRDKLQRALQRSAITVVSVDISVHPDSIHNSPADIGPLDVAAYHPYQHTPASLFTHDRLEAITNMARALEGFMRQQRHVAGFLAAGGATGVAILAPALQALPFGVAKVLVTSLAASDSLNLSGVSGQNLSGQGRSLMSQGHSLIGQSDLALISSPCELIGLNRLTETLLSHGAAALAGMINTGSVTTKPHKPAICLSSFGFTDACNHWVQQQLGNDFDCFVFDALGRSAEAMQHYAQGHQCRAIIDLAPADITDALFGNIFSIGSHRLETMLKTKKPYIGTLGGLDSARFGSPDTLPHEFAERQFYAYTPNITLMRTNRDENEHIGHWLAQQLNQSEGPICLLIPEKGFSALSVEGQPFYNPDADNALITTLQSHFETSPNRQLMSVPYAINDAEFSLALWENFMAIAH